MRLLAGCVMGLALSTVYAVAQTAEPEENISNGGLIHTLQATPVMGQPFSADQVMKKGKTLADGTNITHFGHHFVARDSSGRVRVEQPCGCSPEHEQKIEVYVLDPIAHTLTTWRTGGDSPKTATVMKLPDPKPEPLARPVRSPGGNSSRPQPIIMTDELPMQTLDTLPMKVVRTTTIVPAGRSGNDKPITKTHTLWTNEDVKLTFMEQWEDPRTGVRTVGLANFSRKEPDPLLFRAPAGFRVEDAKEPSRELARVFGQM